MTSTAPAKPPAPAAPAVKLLPGQLRACVAAHLAADPTAEFTVTQIAKALSASGGAVGNALLALAATGAADQTSQTPRRYRATATTKAASAFTTTLTGRPAAPAAKAPVASADPGAAKPRRKRARTTAVGKPPMVATPAPVAWTGGPVVRPNGQEYHPRDLGGHADVTALRMLRAAGVPAMLYGPPGTGKTSMVEAAFPDLVTVAGDNNTTVGNLLG
jgi:nitric oxide reductase NorQ protein